MTPLARDILDFWFGPPPHAARPQWFAKDPQFDAAIRTRYGAALDAALAGAPRSIHGSAHDALAHVVLLDQFTRNAVLGRASTPEELEFLRQPGSRF